MKNQDSATMIITFLLLIPWLGRAAVSAMAAWREYTEGQSKKKATIMSRAGARTL